MIISKTGKDALTNFKVIKRWKDHSLVVSWPETGRKHQLRVHFQKIGFPICNDPLYNKKPEKKTNEGQFLHAWKIFFQHPINIKQMGFKTRIPFAFKEKLKRLDQK
jgi:23S rRNA pseudouridine1911/1915/1917 synthase